MAGKEDRDEFVAPAIHHTSNHRTRTRKDYKSVGREWREIEDRDESVAPEYMLTASQHTHNHTAHALL